MKKQDVQKGEIIIYQTSKREAELHVRLKNETVLLTQAQIALLFESERSVITKHLRNIFTLKELDKNSVCAKIAHTASDGKTYKTQFYNLDAIISVGYRVNSRQATQFRIWATKVLKKHLIKGYTINQKRLLQSKNKFKELREAVLFLQEKSRHKLLSGQEQEILSLLSNYAKTLTLLEKYDKEKLTRPKGKKSKFILDYDNCKDIITKLKKELIAKKEAGDIFGQEYEGKFNGILGSVYQTFGAKELYLSIEEKAAHILYFIIKDHPFTDGNKRIGSFLFIYFLDKNNYLYKKSGEKKINDNAMTALALLIAVSDPKEKEKMIKIITNLLSV